MIEQEIKYVVEKQSDSLDGEQMILKNTSITTKNI